MDLTQDQQLEEEVEGNSPGRGATHVDRKVAAVAASMERTTIQQEPVIKKGTAGKTIPVTANYIRLELLKEDKMYEYEVNFQPTIDSKDERFKIIKAQSEVLGATRTFDGVCLYLPFLLKDLPTVLHGENPTDQSPVKLIITLKHVKKMTDNKSIQFYNVLFRRIMHRLESYLPCSIYCFHLIRKVTLSCQAEDGADEQELLRPQ